MLLENTTKVNGREMRASKWYTDLNEMLDGGNAMSLVYAVVTDLFFADRIGNALKQLGHEAEVTDISLGAAPALPPGVNLIIIDLEAGEPAFATITMARDAGLPVLAFGPHTESALREAALAAGATRVVPKSKLTTSFAELVTAMLI
jgi:DNA-binding NarL/FixJ family response regulator